jgi:hypothetical protein
VRIQKKHFGNDPEVFEPNDTTPQSSVIIVVVPVAVVVIFMIPVALVQLPSLLIVVVVRMVPIRALVRRLLPASRNPSLLAAVWGPITFNPGIAWAGRIAAPLVTYRRGCAADIQGNLC